LSGIRRNFALTAIMEMWQDSRRN